MNYWIDLSIEYANQRNYLDDLCSTLKALNSSLEILEEKSITYITQIEDVIDNTIQKYKSINNHSKQI